MMFSSRTLTDPQPLGIDIDLRTDFLEDHWGDDEAGCEAIHKKGPLCTVAVTHRAFSCKFPHGQNVCTAGAGWLKRKIAGSGTCAHCRKLTAECWSVIPV